MPFKLSATLQAHSEDVRALVTPSDDLILSASRDSTAISWIKASGSSFSPAHTFRSGPRFINSVAYLPPTPEAPRGYIVTGSQDSTINIWAIEPTREEPLYTLLGHSENVCALHVGGDGTIISGSWDKTAKVWTNFQLSVWAVVVMDGEEYLTGSADKTIKLWRQHKCLRTFHGHKDAVRSLALLTNTRFASGSNDSEITIWTFEGDIVHSLSAHTSFVYTISILPNGDIASGGEDRSLRIWRDEECYQTIIHPAISVWSVSAVPNGDIVTGASDGVIRIFSEAEERWASSEDLMSFDDLVASQALPAQQVGDVKKSDLPGPEALSSPGRKPGEVKMIQSGTITEAHQWDSARNQWQKIGEVVDAVGSGRRQLHEGREYDYVFDVDIQDGVPPLKLPYNANENPFTAARRFLEQNDLPLSYIDQVVHFIEKNTGGVNLGRNEEYVDPFTGASRHRPSASTSSVTPASAYSDPYTGESRYISTGSSAVTPPTASSSYSDPFTGASRYVSGFASTVTDSPASTISVIPVSKALSFKQANVSAMQGKLYQFDQALRSEISTSALAMYPDEIGHLEETFTFLAQSTAGKSPTVKLTNAHVETVVQMLNRWPASQRFPVIDLARLLSGFCADLIDNNTFFDALFRAAELAIDNGTSPSSKAKETNVLLVLRTVANAFQEGTKIGDRTWVEKIFGILGGAPYEKFTKGQRLALSTVLFNFSCIVLQGGVDRSLRAQHINIISNVLRLESGDVEVAYRALVGLGNVLYAAREQETSLEVATISTLITIVKVLPVEFKDGRIGGIVGEILALA
ncbi:phospholipase A-2-activating protein [Multifurca ochricompacta]|uniref:Phospholipase A-2-activating protein n=1 Tax=Multifurca ochricompacta TaxID=376703 RepID=A0AAD4QRM5_9AGAM|nr:phospholipase A-2-activating protein [Multifurca ochricompacta]